MPHSFIDETGGNVGFDIVTVLLELVVRKLRGHETSSGKRKCNPRCVYRYPATSPLLGDICGRPRSTCRIKHDVAWVSCHQNCSGNYRRTSLNNIDFWIN